MRSLEGWDDPVSSLRCRDIGVLAGVMDVAAIALTLLWQNDGDLFPTLFPRCDLIAYAKQCAVYSPR